MKSSQVRAPTTRQPRAASNTSDLPEYARAMPLPKRCLVGGAVAVVAFGLLSMHGVAASGTSVENAGHETHKSLAVAGDIPLHGDLDHSMQGTPGAHNPLHVLGQACLWLLASGALLVLAHQSPQSRTPRLHTASRERRDIWLPSSTLDHPPDPRLATVALRC